MSQEEQTIKLDQRDVLDAAMTDPVDRLFHTEYFRAVFQQNMSCCHRCVQHIPPIDELVQATELFVLCVKLVSVDKLLENM